MRLLCCFFLLAATCTAQEDKVLTQDELAEIWDKMPPRDREDASASFDSATWLTFPLSLCRAAGRGQQIVYPNGGFGDGAETDWPKSFTFDATVRIGDYAAGVLRYVVTPQELGYTICWDNKSWYYPAGDSRSSSEPIVFRLRDGDPERLMIVESPRWDPATSTHPTTSLVVFSSDFGLAGGFNGKNTVTREKGALVSYAGRHAKVSNRFDAKSNTFVASIPQHFSAVSIMGPNERTEARRVHGREVRVTFAEGTDEFAGVKSLPQRILIKQFSGAAARKDEFEVLCEIRLRQFAPLSLTAQDATSKTKAELLPDSRQMALSKLAALYAPESEGPPFSSGLRPNAEVSEEDQDQLSKWAWEFDPESKHVPKTAAELTKLRLRIMVMLTTGRETDRLLPALKRYCAILNREGLAAIILRSTNELSLLLHSFGRDEQAYAARVWASAFFAQRTQAECLDRIRNGPPNRGMGFSIADPEHRYPLTARMDAMLAEKLLSSGRKLEPVVECELRYLQCVLAKVPARDTKPLPSIAVGQCYAKAERLYADLPERDKSKVEELRRKASKAVGRGGDK